jgi:hypothetical protein
VKASAEAEGGSSVTKTFDKDYVIQDSDLPITEGDPGYTADSWNINPVDQKVTSDVIYTISFKNATYQVSVPEGFTAIGSATHGSKLTFTPSASGKIVTNVTAKIGDASITVTKNEDGSYSIDGDAITGNITIEATTVEGSLLYIAYDTYKALASGTKIAILKTTQLNGSKYTLSDGENSKDFFWSSRYNGYVAIVDSAWTDAQLASKIITGDGDAIALSYNGDINGSGSTTAGDSGYITDILHNVTANYDVTDRMRLEMDVVGDEHIVGTNDISWILEEAVGYHPSYPDDDET